MSITDRLDELAKTASESHKASPDTATQRIDRLAAIELPIVQGMVRQLEAERDVAVAAARQMATTAARQPLRSFVTTWPKQTDWQDALLQAAPDDLVPMAITGFPFKPDVFDPTPDQVAGIIHHLRRYAVMPSMIMMNQEGEWLQSLHGLRGPGPQAKAIELLERVVDAIRVEFGHPDDGGPLVGVYNLPMRGWRSLSESQWRSSMGSVTRAMRHVDVGMPSWYGKSIDVDIRDATERLPLMIDACLGRPCMPVVCPHLLRSGSDAVSPTVFIRDHWLPAVLPSVLTAEGSFGQRVWGLIQWHNHERMDDPAAVTNEFWRQISDLLLMRVPDASDVAVDHDPAMSSGGIDG